MPATRILYCNCSYAKIIPGAVKRDVLNELSDSGVAFEAVADLCELVARKNPALERLASTGDSDEQDLRIAACYPRAVRWLFAAGGAPLPEDGVSICNMRTESAEDIVRALRADEPPAGDLSATPGVDGPPAAATQET